MFTTHPAAYSVELDLLLKSGGSQKGEKVTSIRIPGASRGVLDSFPYAQTHRHAADLFAVYRQGIVQVSFNDAKRFTTASLIAVLRLVTAT